MSFLRLAAPTGTAAVVGKAVPAPRWASCAWGEQCGVWVCVWVCPAGIILSPVPGGNSGVCVLQGSFPLSLLPAFPCALEKSRAGGCLGCAAAALPHTQNFSVFPFHSCHILVGQGKKKISIFQGRKIKGEFLSSMWHNPTKWMLRCHCWAVAAQYVTLVKWAFF